ncbi:MAG TPA: hypothetical protein VIH89_19815 [Candidatus Sulfotelmatobacter sp.]
MAQEVQVGTILMKEWPLMASLLGLEVEPYLAQWKLIKGMDSAALDGKIHTARWNFFFMATETRSMFFGTPGAKNLQNALKRILRKTGGDSFNCLEVTGIVAKRFLGVPYTSVSAHSRHIQQDNQLEGIQRRQVGQRDAALAQA